MFRMAAVVPEQFRGPAAEQCFGHGVGEDVRGIVDDEMRCTRGGCCHGRVARLALRHAANSNSRFYYHIIK
jgi:hypothetical protein